MQVLTESMDTLDPQHFMSGELLYADVKAYSAFGEHRTAGKADRDTSAWLGKQLEGFGFKVKLAPLRCRQFQFESAHLSANGRSIPCFPLWFPKATAAPVHSMIARGVIKDRVALARFPKGGAITPAHLAVIEPLIRAGAAAIVAVTPSESGELVALNAVPAEPWPIPILLISPSEEMALRGAMQVDLSIQGRDDPRAEAFNTIAEFGAGKKRVVISTPSSGWFHCAGERGPGIAIWLALARWASHREADVRYTFVATSGHEIGELGMRQLLASQAPLPEQVGVWLHLGASIAARGSTRRLTTNQRAWLPELTRNFAAIPDLHPEMSESPVGELAQLAKLRYRCLGIAGGHPLFHSRGDLPSITSAALLEPVGQALLRTVAGLESQL